MSSHATAYCLSADRKTIANALRLAAGCAGDARLLHETGSRNAAYLAEQSLEQVTRAIATSEAIHIERSDAHQLDKFVRRLPDVHPEKSALHALSWLEAYATAYRYTSPSGAIPKAPDSARLDAAIDDILSLIDRVSAHFQVELQDEASAAGSSSPMRR